MTDLSFITAHLSNLIETNERLIEDLERRQADAAGEVGATAIALEFGKPLAALRRAQAALLAARKDVNGPDVLGPYWFLQD